MDFELSADQQALQAAARQLLGDLSDSTAVRAHIGTGEPYDAKLWGAMAEQGWFAVAVEESAGGLGLGWVEAAVLLEEVGAHVSPVPIASVLLVLEALRGQPAHSPLAAQLMSGAAVVCVAPASAGAVTVVEKEGTLRLTGRLGPVEAASVASAAVVVEEAGVYLVDLVSAGLNPSPEPAMDLTRCLSWLRLEGTPAVRLGGAEMATRIGALGAMISSAELLGSSQRVLDMATQYAKDRVQFGAPIGSFQAVKHRCADMLVDVEGMRSATWYAAWAAAADEAGWEMAASTAKVWCADASRRVMSSGLQVHGGIGFTWDHDLHLYMKRAQFAEGAFGDAAYHRTLIAQRLKEAVRAGRGVAT